MSLANTLPRSQVCDQPVMYQSPSWGILSPAAQPDPPSRVEGSRDSSSTHNCFPLKDPNTFSLRGIGQPMDETLICFGQGCPQAGGHQQQMLLVGQCLEEYTPPRYATGVPSSTTGQRQRLCLLSLRSGRGQAYGNFDRLLTWPFKLAMLIKFMIKFMVFPSQGLPWLIFFCPN